MTDVTVSIVCCWSCLFYSMYKCVVNILLHLSVYLVPQVWFKVGFFFKVSQRASLNTEPNLNQLGPNLHTLHYILWPTVLIAATGKLNVAPSPVRAHVIQCFNFSKKQGEMAVCYKEKLHLETAGTVVGELSLLCAYGMLLLHAGSVMQVTRRGPLPSHFTEFNHTWGDMFYP